mmetsp:Transcript_1483/g.1537  ORF Transcript_1483/g.1537 Transcript_1483/m.1537 type:complete len:100 (-) Transcript_1483:41-340(-)
MQFAQQQPTGGIRTACCWPLFGRWFRYIALSETIFHVHRWTGAAQTSSSSTRCGTTLVSSRMLHRHSKRILCRSQQPTHENDFGDAVPFAMVVKKRLDS